MCHAQHVRFPLPLSHSLSLSFYGIPLYCCFSFSPSFTLSLCPPFSIGVFVRLLRRSLSQLVGEANNGAWRMAVFTTPLRQFYQLIPVLQERQRYMVRWIDTRDSFLKIISSLINYLSEIDERNSEKMNFDAEKMEITRSVIITKNLKLYIK